MYNTNIKSWKKPSLKQYVLEDDGSLTGFALFTLGIMAALLHQHLRVGLNMPGHHGLEWLTLLLFGRMQSRYLWAGLLIAGGAATSYLLQALSGPLAHSSTAALFYLLNGAVVDVLYRRVPTNLPVIFKGMILGGVSFMAKPLVLIPVVILFDVASGSIDKHGYYFPVLTHFKFGSIGAITGILLAQLSISELRKPKS